jgi:hypothetical protein
MIKPATYRVNIKYFQHLGYRDDDPYFKDREVIVTMYAHQTTYYGAYTLFYFINENTHNTDYRFMCIQIR